MKIIPAGIDKLNDFQQVITLAFSSTPDEDLGEWYSFNKVEKSLDSSMGKAFLAVKENITVGAVHAQPESPIFGKEGLNKWQITNIGVLPSHQRQGIGGRLLKTIEDEAKRIKVEKLIVHTNPDDRRAVSFYIKYDYKPVGIIEDYYYRGPAQFFIKRF
jgi:ribosomal protein S18 acetylase RimI-like enzyme